MTLPIADYVTQLAGQDVKLWVEEGKLRCNAPQGVLTAELQRELASRKQELLEFVARGRADAGKAGIGRRSADGPIPLTQGQERIWSLARMEPDSSVYNVPTVFRLSGPLDVPALEKALTAIQRRHDTLRTVFPGSDLAGARQVIQPAGDVVLPVAAIGRDLRKLPPEQAKREVARLQQQEVRGPFDLAQGPLWRARLFRLGQKEHLLAFTMHHIIFDGGIEDDLPR
jgi:hypothetical protein